MLTKLFLVFAGGGLGAIARELLILAVANLPGGFPTPIFIANITAAFFIGLITGLASRAGMISDNSKLFIITGVLGGLSTFSSFVWGTDQLLLNGEQLTALVYLVLSIVLGFGAVQIGLVLGSRISLSNAATGNAK